MTNYKVKKANKEGYKQVSFKLTFNRKINKPSSKQIIKMAKHYEKYGSFGGEFWYGILDYQTGQSLDFNDKDISISTSDWKYSKTKKYVAKDKSWISYARKATVTIKIVYPESYKDLVVCVGGATTANGLNLYSFWDGNGKFSNQKKLYSKKDKKYAHAMRVK